MLVHPIFYNFELIYPVFLNVPYYFFRSTMKCLHICNDFLGSKVHLQLYEGLDAIGIEQHIFHGLREYQKNNLITTTFEVRNSAVHYSKKLKKYHRILFRRKISFLYDSLLNSVDLSEIHISHATTLFSDGALALEIYRNYKIPYIVTVRTTDVQTFGKYRPDLFVLATKILRNASKVIFIAKSLKTSFYNHYFFKLLKKSMLPKSLLINNGIDQFWIDHLNAQKQIHPSKIIYVGTFLERKNVVSLIQAVLKLKSHYSDLEITIIGKGGKQEEHIKQLAKENPSAVTFIGPLNDKNDLLRAYRENHIFAMPSYVETFGLVYVEALTQGLPILYSEKDGIDGTFTIRVGEAVNPFSANDIALGLEKIITNYTDYEIEQIDFSKFSWRSIAKNYASLYQSILENNQMVRNRF